MNIASSSFFKKRNVLAVLNALNQQQMLSRAELARRTSLTPATISNIIGRLKEAGIVDLKGTFESSRGRRPVMLQFNPNAFFLAGVDIGLAKALCVLIDLHGNVVKRDRINLSEGMSRDSILKAVRDMVVRLLRSDERIGKNVIGVGISYPGLVDTENGIGLVAPNNPELNNVALAEFFRSELKIFTCLENDGACMVLGQARFGVGRGVKNLLGLVLGRGIGSGILINGEVYHGLSSTAGECGHITIIPNGPTCGCGNQGCLEVLASGAAIAHSAARLLQGGRPTRIRDKVAGDTSNVSAQIVAEAALEGDELANELMLQAASYIGIALADVINILNPEMVIFSGGLSLAGDYFLDKIKETASKRAYTFGALRPPRFAMADFGDAANCIGAAALVLDHVLDVDFQGIWGILRHSRLKRSVRS
jgi:N-acetylglucosamine repressor